MRLTALSRRVVKSQARGGSCEGRRQSRRPGSADNPRFTKLEENECLTTIWTTTDRIVVIENETSSGIGALVDGHCNRRRSGPAVCAEDWRGNAPRPSAPRAEVSATRRRISSSEVTEYGEPEDSGARRESVENRIDSTRQAVELKRRQVSNAVDAGRAAAQQARVELEQRIAETKAAYKES